MSEMKMLVFGIFVFVVAFDGRNAVAEDGVHWRYFGIYGVEHWSTLSDVCDASTHDRQSPIDIIQPEALYDHTLTPISLEVSGPSSDTITVVNNGHTVNFGYDRSAVRIHGGHLEGRFRVGGVHFHWGSNNSVGSEHRLDHEQFLMEMHVVTFDESRYNGVLNASGGINSIAVLGVLFKLSDKDNLAFGPLISNIKSVTTTGSQVTIPYFDLSSLLPSNTVEYFRYLGSLTTPPCSENVVWTVFTNPQTISPRQLSEFRKLQEMIEPDGVTIDYLNNNWRPPQPLYGRPFQRSFHTSMDAIQIPSSLPASMSSTERPVLAMAIVVFNVVVANIG